MNDMSPQLPSTQSSHVLARQTVMQKLHNSTRMNEYGLPTQAYRPDLIPGDLFERPQEEQTSILQLAIVPIVYEGGLPVVEGKLYWEQLPWEPKDDYAKFTDYRRLQETYGYRSINLLVQDPNQEKAVGDDGDDEEQIARDRVLLERLRQQYIYYAWGFRVKAYDMVGVVAYDRLRERRAIETENHHYIQLDSMFKQTIAHWTKLNSAKGDSNPWDELGIMDTLKAMKGIIELQRVASGMPASTPLTAKEAGGDPLRGHSMETRLKSHAKSQQALEDNGVEDLLGAEELLKDPRLLAMAQELILSASTRATAQDEAIDIGDVAMNELNETKRADGRSTASDPNASEPVDARIVPDKSNGRSTDD